MFVDTENGFVFSPFRYFLAVNLSEEYVLIICVLKLTMHQKRSSKLIIIFFQNYKTWVFNNTYWVANMRNSESIKMNKILKVISKSYLLS